MQSCSVLPCGHAELKSLYSTVVVNAHTVLYALNVRLALQVQSVTQLAMRQQLLSTRRSAGAESLEAAAPSGAPPAAGAGGPASILPLGSHASLAAFAAAAAASGGAPGAIEELLHHQQQQQQQQHHQSGNGTTAPGPTPRGAPLDHRVPGSSPRPSQWDSVGAPRVPTPAFSHPPHGQRLASGTPLPLNGLGLLRNGPLGAPEADHGAAGASGHAGNGEGGAGAGTGAGAGAVGGGGGAAVAGRGPLASSAMQALMTGRIPISRPHNPAQNMMGGLLGLGAPGGGLSDGEKELVLDLALCSCEELVEMAQMGEPLWRPADAATGGRGGGAEASMPSGNAGGAAGARGGGNGAGATGGAKAAAGAGGGGEGKREGGGEVGAWPSSLPATSHVTGYREVLNVDEYKRRFINKIGDGPSTSALEASRATGIALIAAPVLLDLLIDPVTRDPPFTAPFAAP